MASSGVVNKSLSTLQQATICWNLAAWCSACDCFWFCELRNHWLGSWFSEWGWRWGEILLPLPWNTGPSKVSLQSQRLLPPHQPLRTFCFPWAFLLFPYPPPGLCLLDPTALFLQCQLGVSSLTLSWPLALLVHSVNNWHLSPRVNVIVFLLPFRLPFCLLPELLFL